MGSCSAEQVERQYNEESSQTCIQRAPQGFGDTVIYYHFEIVAHTSLHILSNAVEYNHNIIHADADNRQNAGNKQSIDLNTSHPAQNGENGNNHHQVVYQGNNGTGAPTERIGHLAERPGNIEQNSYRSHHNSDYSVTHRSPGSNRRNAVKAADCNRSIQPRLQTFFQLRGFLGRYLRQTKEEIAFPGRLNHH